MDSITLSRHQQGQPHQGVGHIVQHALAQGPPAVDGRVQTPALAGHGPQQALVEIGFFWAQGRIFGRMDAHRWLQWAAAASVLRFDMWVMLAASLACLPIFVTGRSIARWEGAVFVGYYAAYVTWLVLQAQQHAAAETFSAAMLGFVVPLTVVTLTERVSGSCAKKSKAPPSRQPSTAACTAPASCAWRACTRFSTRPSSASTARRRQ